MYYGKIRHLTDDLQAQCRIIKEQFRCHKFGFEDMVNFMTCELNNVRISHKMRHITNLSIFNIMPMKKFFCIFGGLLLATGLEAQTLGGWPNWTKYIENTVVFEENQEEGHAFYVPENNMSLNGKWNFLYLDVPTKVPANFYAEDFDDIFSSIFGQHARQSRQRPAARGHDIEIEVGQNPVVAVYAAI